MEPEERAADQPAQRTGESTAESTGENAAEKSTEGAAARAKAVLAASAAAREKVTLSAWICLSLARSLAHAHAHSLCAELARGGESDGGKSRADHRGGAQAAAAEQREEGRLHDRH